MPFYEFYCEDCHRIFNFYSRQIDTEKTPNCPRCSKRSLQRMISKFSALKDTSTIKDKGGFSSNNDIDVIRSKLFLENELKTIDRNDPRQMAKVLKKLGDATGNHLGSGLQNVLSQIENGGNINELQLELESILTKYEEKSETEFGAHRFKGSMPPVTDEEVYEF